MHLMGDCMSLLCLQASHCLNEALRKSHGAKPFDIVQYSSYGATAYYRVRHIPAVVRLSSYQTLRRKMVGVSRPTRDDLRYERFERRAICKGDRIFGPSKLTIDAVQKDTERPVAFVPTPFVLETTQLDASIFQRFLQGRSYLLFFGSLWNLKGVGLIVEILPELLQRNPGLSFVFVGKDLGGGSGIKAMQQSYPDRILSFDRLPHSQLYPIIRESFAVVLPSLYDNCPNACIEAMAFGRIVIGSRNAGFEELIDHGNTGFLCRRGDSADLLRVLNEVLGLPRDIGMALGEAALKRVLELRPQRTIPKLISLYEDVLSSRRRGSAFTRSIPSQDTQSAALWTSI